MRDKASFKNICKVGYLCVYLVGLCYFIISICALISPAPVASYVASNLYFVDFEGYRNYFIFLKYLMALANAAMIGVVIAFCVLKGDNYKHHIGWISLFSILAISGLIIGMLQSVQDATQVPHLAQEYEKSSALIKHVMIAFGVANPAIYMLSLGLPGLWMIFMALLYRKKLPKSVTLFTIIWGAGCVCTVFAHLFVIIWMIYCIAWGSLIGVPLWTKYLGSYLKKLSRD